MAYNKRTWLGRQGTGLNKFSIGGASPVTIVNQPDSVTQVGDALSAGNLNDLEDRIEDAFDDVDTALDTKADEQDVTNLNNAITAIDHRVQNLEQAKGKYVVQNYKDGAITPSGKGAWAIVEGLRGVSRVENNQLPSISTFNTYQVTKGATVDNVLTVSNITGINAQVYCNCPIPLGRTVLAGVYLKPSVQTTAMLVIGSQKFVENVVCPANTWTFLGNVITISGTADYFSIYPNRNEEMGSADSAQIKLVGLTDLNVYFGGSIPADADTFAHIQQNYPHLLLPSDYGVRIVDSSYSGVRAWARNLWDEEWEVGSIANADGQDTYSSTTIRGKNYFPVVPLTSYCFCAPYNGILFWYDAQKNYVGLSSAAKDEVLTSPSGAYFARFRMSSDYGIVYHNDICINKSDSQNGTYTPYHAPDTLSLTFQGKSAGSVADTLELNVEVDGVAKKRETSRIGVMTFNGTENWLKSGSSGAFYLTLDNTTFPYKWASDVQALSRYVYLGTGGQSADVLADKDDAMGIYYMGDPTITTREIWIKDTSFATTTAWKEHLAQNPLIVYYEKDTPVVTLSDPIIDNTLLTEAGGRMSTVQTGTVVDGSFDMGFITL